MLATNRQFAHLGCGPFCKDYVGSVGGRWPERPGWCDAGRACELGCARREAGGGPRGTGCRSALIRCYRSRTPQHGLETDSQRFSVSFTMFCCYWRISFCLFVLQCHILPCSRFNFLIEKNVLRMPFFFCSCLFWVFFFFYVISFDLMWLLLYSKKVPVPWYLMLHLAMWRPGSRALSGPQPPASATDTRTRSPEGPGVDGLRAACRRPSWRLWGPACVRFLSLRL